MKSAERFSSRIEYYIKYRPGYPPGILESLKTDCDLTPDSLIADIGSGTGKLSELFLVNGNAVLGVEPNAGMRAAAEEIFRRVSSFRSIKGSAEETTLANESVDFVTAGQAFHWFDPIAFKREATRILRHNGWTVLVWNGRKLTSTPFLTDYENLLLTYGTDYQDIRHEKAESLVPQFFEPNTFTARLIPNQQVFDLDGLKGRVRSSSYTPEPDHPNFQAMMGQIEDLFAKHQRNGTVVFEYDTRVFYGPFT
jgi:SAM-dependent methyltransferase